MIVIDYDCGSRLVFSNRRSQFTYEPAELLITPVCPLAEHRVAPIEFVRYIFSRGSFEFCFTGVAVTAKRHGFGLNRGPCRAIEPDTVQIELFNHIVAIVDQCVPITSVEAAGKS